ncbi:MAG TPA: branched-chain amino acid ABC transporter permease [Microbacteriaceae bacterium]
MDFFNALIQGLLIGGLYALFASGLSLMFGVMRIVNLAHGDLAIVAAYLALIFVVSTPMPVWLIVIVMVPLFALIGYVVQRGLFARSMKAGPLATILVTFGLSIVLQNLLLQFFSADTQTISAGALTTAAWHINSQISFSYLSLITFGLAIAAIVFIQLFISRTKLGRMMRASSDDPQIAAVVGGDSRHIYGVATAIAFGTVALAGLMFAMRSSFDPTQGPTNLLFAFEAVVIGGLGSLWGTLLGGTILGLTQTFVAFWDPSFSVLACHVIFLAVLAFRPQGLIPRRAV